MTNSPPAPAILHPARPPGPGRPDPGLPHEPARADPNAFLALCFTDPAGRPLRQAAVHRELQAFLSAHPRALVELPRDHGKSVPGVRPDPVGTRPQPRRCG